MTREEWRRAEPILTRALLLPEADREALLGTANLGEALRRDLMEVLRRSPSGSPSVAMAGTASAPTTWVPRAVPRPPALPPGAALANGRYVVVRQIGRGGMGTVFLGHDTTFGTLVALKVMPYDERLLAEARRAAVCSDHPNVATIHNVLKEQVGDQELGVLVMEYVAGTPASRIVDDGPVDVGRVLKWGRQVAAAIGHAHEHQVLHCDLKPANIVIAADGRAKVLDFGISRATFDPADPAEPVRGTMPYMAPEQLLSSHFSPAGDIYSLGVTLFELATGRLPFDADDDHLLRLRIVAAPPPAATELVADIPLELQSALERAMAKEPDKRFRSAHAFERALAAIEEGGHYSTTNIHVPVPQPPPPLSVWGRIGLALLVVMSAVVAAMLLGAYTSAVYNHILGRAGFVSESVGDWLNFGLRASGGPVVLLVVTTLAWVVVRFIGRLGLSAVDPRGRTRAQLSAFYRGVCRWLRCDDVTAKSVAAFLASASALAVAIALHRDLIPAFVAVAVTSPPERLALLSPDYVAQHNAFRQTFTMVVILTVAVWYPLVKTADRRRVVPRGLLLAGVATLVAAFVLLHYPHRLLFSEIAGYGIENVRWNEQDCYALGQRGSDTLLLCPSAEKRDPMVRTGDSSVVRLGTRESPFRGFYRLAERNRRLVEGAKSQPED